MNATTPSRLSAFPRSSSCVMALWQVAEKLSHMVRGMHMTYIIFNSSFFLLMVTFTLFCFVYSHPSLAAYSSRSVCLEGLKQSWCRQGAGYTERSCGLHAAKTCAVPSGMFTSRCRDTACYIIRYSTHLFSALLMLPCVRCRCWRCSFLYCSSVTKRMKTSGRDYPDRLQTSYFPWLPSSR